MGIKRFVEKVLKNKSNKKQEYLINKVSRKEATKIFEETGINLRGYKRVIDNYTINHIINQHGDTEKEKLRGQVEVKESDFEKIIPIVTKYNEISIEKNVIKYIKSIINQYIYVEEIRKNKKELAGKTMYIKRKKQ